MRLRAGVGAAALLFLTGGLACYRTYATAETAYGRDDLQAEIVRYAKSQGFNVTE